MSEEFDYGKTKPVVLKDETVTLGARKFKYKNEWYEKKGIMPDKEGTVTLCEIDASGKENGLFIRDFYYDESEMCTNKGYTEIGRMKDGQISGPLYGFSDGELMMVKIEGKVVTSADDRFKAYVSTAPQFDNTFKLLQNAQKIVDRRGSSWLYRNVEKLQSKIHDKFLC